MKTQLLLMLSCWLTTSTLIAQEPVSFTLLFPSANASLTPNMEELLKKKISSIDLRRVHHVSISGHTDAVGSFAYNDALAKQRTKTVYDYLVKLGVHKQSMRFGSFGERMPILSNANEANLQANRRVEVFIDFIEFSTLSEFHEKLESGVTSVHLIHANEPTRIQGTMGTEVNIPANAFLNNDGQPAEGNLRFILTEALTNEQFTKEELSMSSNGRLLETGGMVELSVVDDSERKLSMRDGARLQLTIPSNERLAGMQTFVSDDGSNWESEKAPKSSLIKLPTRPYRYNIRKYKSNFNFKRDLATKPRKPVDPLFPRAPEEPNALDFNRPVKWYKFLRKKEIEALANKTYLTALNRYQSRLKKYERKVDLYALDCKAMPEDLEKYYLQAAAWDNQQIQDSIAQLNAWRESSRVINEKFHTAQAIEHEKALAIWKHACDSIKAINQASLRTMQTSDLASTNYVLSTSNLGWINCDRFVAAPDNFFVSIDDPFKQEGNMLIVYDNIRSMIKVPKFTINGISQYKYSGLPLGRKARLVAYTVEAGKLQMSITPFEAPFKTIRDFEPASMGDFMDAISNTNVRAQN